jgi:hypothetical protein
MFRIASLAGQGEGSVFVYVSLAALDKKEKKCYNGRVEVKKRVFPETERPFSFSKKGFVGGFFWGKKRFFTKTKIKGIKTKIFVFKKWKARFRVLIP